VMCVPFYFSTIRPLQASFGSLQLSVNSNRVQSSTPAAVDHSSDTPGEQLAEFINFSRQKKLRPTGSVNGGCGEPKGLALNHGEIRGGA